jgi:predicted ABC-type transport system involved in lysophospholipase L1 biosynthesis ATPase subunit
VVWSTEMSTAHIVVNGVNKSFKTADRELVALKDIQLEIAQGQFVCLLGPSSTQSQDFHYPAVAASLLTAS